VGKEMNWYKTAQYGTRPPVFSREALADLANLNRTLPGKTVSDIRDHLISVIRSNQMTIKDSYPGTVKMYGANPMGLHTQGYRVGLQICKDKEGKKYILVRRIFEHHDEYEKWLASRGKWSDLCGSYEPRESGGADEIRPVPLDPKSPRNWLVATVKALYGNEPRLALEQKKFLEGKSNDNLIDLMALIDAEGKGIRKDIKDRIYMWIEEHWDMNE
jgi:hypothetical protein